jgi:phosphonate transport system substrate-binding protein
VNIGTRPCIALLAALALACAASCARADGLVFGVHPHLSATQVVNQYSLLRDLLARSLGRPVTMVSAPDFPSFIERTHKGEFDIVLTAPHMGRLAEKREGWLPVAQTGYQLEIVVLARPDSAVQQRADLRDKAIAIGPRDSMGYQVIAAALAQEGLVLERDIRVIEATSFAKLMHALTRGDAAAGAISRQLWSMAPESQRNAVREIFHAQPAPGFFVMAHPRLGAAAVQSLRKALLNFHAAPEGKAYFRKTQQVDFRPIDDETMRRIDPYTAVLESPRQ